MKIYKKMKINEQELPQAGMRPPKTVLLNILSHMEIYPRSTDPRSTVQTPPYVI